MIDNIDIAYCMAKLEDKIRWEWDSAQIYLECCGAIEDSLYKKTIARWSTMIRCFEVAFGVNY